MTATMLAVVSGRPSDQRVLSVALALARQFKAHIKVLHAHSEEWPFIYASAGGMSGAAEIMAAIERENRQAAAVSYRSSSLELRHRQTKRFENPRTNRS